MGLVLKPQMHTHSVLRPLVAVALATMMLLALPLIAMQVTDAVSWTPVDFVVAGCLLFSAGSAMVFGVRRATTTRGRVTLVAVVVLLLALVWAQLAVGLFT